jgi:DNA-binding transcriptional ArsR family regulator
MRSDDDRLVGDPAALKALSHPLRVRLLAELREIGPSTATDLARRLDTDSGSTSYHLRVLGRHGFVEEAPADGSRRHPRERRWVAAHGTTSWDNRALAESAAGREASSLMRRQQVEVLARDVDKFDRSLRDLDPAWVEVSGIGDLVVRLTPEAVTELWESFYAHLDELVARTGESPEARRVSVVVAGFPRAEQP